MSGSIFVVSEDNKILELKESKYENEAIFQYISGRSNFTR